MSGARETDANRAAMFSVLGELPFGWECQLNELRKANKTINNYDKRYEGKKQGARENNIVGGVGVPLGWSGRVLRRCQKVLVFTELGNSVLNKRANPLAVSVLLFR